MSAVSDSNKALMARFFQQVFNEGDMAIVDAVIGPDYKYNGHPTSAADTKAWAQSLRSKYPDLHFVIETMLGEDDKVALRWRMLCTDPQSGQKVSATGTNIIVIVNHQAISNDQGGGNEFTPVT